MTRKTRVGELALRFFVYLFIYEEMIDKDLDEIEVRESLRNMKEAEEALKKEIKDEFLKNGHVL